VRWLGLVILLLIACRDPGPPTGGPMRLVSLTPSATEVIAALGATDRLVGVDDFSSYPPEVTALPKVGSFTTPNIEAVIRLQPTLVVVDDIHGNAAKLLAGANIATVACAMHGLPDVISALRVVGGKLGKTAEAERVIGEIDAAIALATKQRPAVRPRVLAIIDREVGGLGNIVAVGPGSWVHELLDIVGAENVLGSAGTRYPKISLEEVLRSKPDIIVDLAFAGKGGIEPWKSVDVPAVHTGRVFALHEQYLIAPSPRVKLAIEALSKAVSTPPTE
jgi:iron complex transport system substrate-binding protein